jgi:hypothetical protein
MDWYWIKTGPAGRRYIWEVSTQGVGFAHGARSISWSAPGQVNVCRIPVAII